MLNDLEDVLADTSVGRYRAAERYPGGHGFESGQATHFSHPTTHMQMINMNILNENMFKMPTALKFKPYYLI
jgi:hypothetical protein